MEKAYKYRVEKVMEDRSGRDKIGIGSGDASMDGTIFVRVTKKIGALFFVKNPEEAGKVFEHYRTCSKILNKAIKKGNIHPLVGPIPLIGENERPVLLRRIGLTLDKNCDVERAEIIGTLLDEYLQPILYKIGFRRSKFNFDLKKPANIAGNKKMINILNKMSLRELESVKGAENAVKKDAILDLFQKWYENGGRLYLFDYGTWLKPESGGVKDHILSDKYGNLHSAQ